MGARAVPVNCDTTVPLQSPALNNKSVAHHKRMESNSRKQMRPFLKGCQNSA